MTENNNKFGYGISVVFHNHEKWVRVQAMGEDFIIAPHDLTDAEGEVMSDCTQPELMERLEELGLTTFNRKQGFIIATLIEEINAKLEVAGGDKFAEDWYASSELWRPVGSSADCNALARGSSTAATAVSSASADAAAASARAQSSLIALRPSYNLSPLPRSLRAARSKKIRTTTAKQGLRMTARNRRANPHAACRGMQGIKYSNNSISWCS